MKITTWYNKQGFIENPFSIKPAFDENLFGYEQEIGELLDELATGNFYLITGDYGNGKTTLLKVIINKFRGKNLIYYNYLKNQEEMDFEKLLTDMNALRKIFKVKRKENILLVDEAHDISKADLKKLSEMTDSRHLKSVVIIANEKIRSNPQIKKIIGKKHIKINRMDKTAAINMIRYRIGDLELLPDDRIIEIYKKSKNTRDFLRNCEDACRLAFRKGEEKVTKSIIKEALK